VSGDVPSLIIGFMFWVLLPVWVLAGVADYLLHRRTAIELTSGAKESALHVLQVAEVGVPLLAGLFLEINSLVLALMIVFAIAHTLTALWDGTYTTPRRFISPLEQHVHSHLEYLPLVAVSLVALLHWDALLGIFGAGAVAPSWSLELKQRPIPTPYVVTVLLLVFVLQGGLLAEEAARTVRAAARARSP
jgi:hypothetical protein